MKAAIFTSLIATGDAFKIVQQNVHNVRGAGGKAESASLAVLASDTEDIKMIASAGADFGSSKCPCIGISGVEGSTKARIGDNVSYSFPADLGATCEAWDNGVNPVSCKEGQKPGKDNGWCAERWCYVDPCNCELDVPPTKSPADTGYLPGADYQGNGLWYSYATCGSKDYWMDAKKKKQQQAEPKTCSAPKDASKWGNPKCKCIGINDQKGVTNVTIAEGEEMSYPADTGAVCSPWDKGLHPDCTSTSPPEWCSQSWCYVDPCECDIATPPKTSAYLPEAKANGKPVYYSYATCGAQDSFAETNKKACVNQKTEVACSGLSKCAWNGKECLGKELVEVCGKEKPGSASKLSTSSVDAPYSEKALEQATEINKKNKKISFPQGLSKCPCVGIADIDGTTVARLSNGTAIYPADVGAVCASWDNDVEPFACKPGQKPGKDNGWCGEPWCYVDPCNCEIDTPPTKSPSDNGYLPGASYQGVGLWYSYATCGGKDYWMDADKKKKQQSEPSGCSTWTKDAKWGDSKCKCIGIDGQSGTTNVTLAPGKEMAYPADTGATCKSWDQDRHPDCTGSDAPAWCAESWCYVDPCECGMSVPPKTSAYLPEATGNGRPVYYSYATCGSTDHFADTNAEACVNKKSERNCVKASKCAWNGKECFGKELVDICPAPSTRGSEKAGANRIVGVSAAVLLLAFFSNLM